jgi:hypothetical protein
MRSWVGQKGHLGSREPRRLTSGPGNSFVPSFSQDGKWIYISNDRTGRSEIFRVPFEGGAEIQLTHSGGEAPQESAGRQTIYYIGPNWMLHEMSFAGGDQHPLGIDVAGRAFQVMRDGIYFIPTAGKNGTRLRNPILRFCNGAVAVYAVAREYQYFVWSFCICQPQDFSLLRDAKQWAQPDAPGEFPVIALMDRVRGTRRLDDVSSDADRCVGLTRCTLREVPVRLARSGYRDRWCSGPAEETMITGWARKPEAAGPNGVRKTSIRRTISSPASGPCRGPDSSAGSPAPAVTIWHARDFRRAKRLRCEPHSLQESLHPIAAVHGLPC